ncbi:hypothetical protein PHET_00826 [Paragonimus heterotremus]|uniref:Tyrosine-protein kinase n=1 Tax=Paragonimus heterotremus TaxID=100268 RepID=A0A8J4X3C3_9TREM|nr:hypothetical protein PHET_00826 [Paragonimus heterotremus]
MGNCIPSSLQLDQLVASPHINGPGLSNDPLGDGAFGTEEEESSANSVLLVEHTHALKISPVGALYSRLFVRAPDHEQEGSQICPEKLLERRRKIVASNYGFNLSSRISVSSQSIQTVVACQTSVTKSGKSHVEESPRFVSQTSLCTACPGKCIGIQPLSCKHANDRTFTLKIAENLTDNLPVNACKDAVPSRDIEQPDRLAEKHNGSPEDSGLGSCSVCGPIDKCDFSDSVCPTGVNKNDDCNGNRWGLRIHLTRRSEINCNKVCCPPVPPRINCHDSFDRRYRRAPPEYINHFDKLNDKICLYHGKHTSSADDQPRHKSPIQLTAKAVLSKGQEGLEEDQIESNIALCIEGYTRQNDSELSIYPGEKLLVVDREPRSNSHVPLGSGSWWVVKRLGTKPDCINDRKSSNQGRVPANRLQSVTIFPVNHEAWYQVDRAEADRMLLQMGNSIGTYILRPSSDSVNAFAMSLRYFDSNVRLWLVKHYRVRYTIAHDCFYVFRRSAFSTLEQLLAHHTVHADGLLCKLTQPYPRVYQPPVSLSHLEVNRSSFVFVHRLGRGSFGEVWQAMWNNRVPVAIKKLLSNGNMESARFLDEAKLMQRLNHPRIVRLLAVCTEPSTEPVYLVTELMERGSLKSYMHNLTPNEVTFEQLIQMSIWVSEGMVYLEENHFLHRDLRSSNVLVDSQLRLKVADFGLSHMLGNSEEYLGTSRTKFPIRWTAPEGMLKQVYSIKSDVWSFGILLYEILTFCEVPYSAFTSKEVKEHVCSGYRLPRPLMKISAVQATPAQVEYEVSRIDNCLCPAVLYNKMLECWKVEPDFRPSFVGLNAFLESFKKKVKTPPVA